MLAWRSTRSRSTSALPSRHKPRPRLGLVINPIAGMGGKAALNGTDGDSASTAMRLGTGPVAGPRAKRALGRLWRAGPVLDVFVAGAPMGAEVLSEVLAEVHSGSSGDRPDHPDAAGRWRVTVMSQHDGLSTSARDTREAVAGIIAEGVDLLLFAGGDGTARDVVSVTGQDVPVLGIPAGVKMHSGVFATTPEDAGEVAGRFLRPGAPTDRTRPVEVLDVDEDSRRRGVSSVELFDIARAPEARGQVQRAKSSAPPAADGALDALCQGLAEEMEPGRLYVLGPGTTTRRILDVLGLRASVFGVHAVRDLALVAVDLTEEELFSLVVNGGRATIVLGVIGGQGFLLGRGNQQLSGRVVRAVGEENVTIIASAAKLAALNPPVLRVDVGDSGPDAVLTGYHRVCTGPGRVAVLKVVSSS